MAEYWQILRSFSPTLKRLLVASAMLFMAAFGFQAVLQNLFLLRLGFDAKFIGLVWGLGQFVWAIAALPAGYVSGRIGLLNGWRVGLLLFAIGMGLMLLVETLPKDLWPTWLIGCQALGQVGVAFISVSIPPYLMLITEEKERRHAFAVYQANIPAMAFAGSLIAGWLPILFAGIFDFTLDQPAPYRLALWGGPLLLLLAMLPMWGANPGKMIVHDPQQANSEPTPLGLLAFFGIMVYLAAVCEGVVRTFFNVYLDAGLAIPSAQIGSIMGVAQLLPIVATLLAPLLMARWGTGYALAAATLGTSAAMLFLAIAPALWLVSLAYMLLIAMITVAATTRDIMGQELVTPRWRATIAAVAMIGLALGWSTAGIAGGYVIEAWGYNALYLAGALSALLAFILLFAYLRTRRTQVAPEVTKQALT